MNKRLYTESDQRFHTARVYLDTCQTRYEFNDARYTAQRALTVFT